jgi:hypothetical protein
MDLPSTAGDASHIHHLLDHAHVPFARDTRLHETCCQPLLKASIKTCDDHNMFDTHAGEPTIWLESKAAD